MSLFKAQMRSLLTDSGEPAGLCRGEIVPLHRASIYSSPSAARRAIAAWFDASPSRAERWSGHVVAHVNRPISTSAQAILAAALAVITR